MNPRSSNCNADAQTTTPSRRGYSLRSHFEKYFSEDMEKYNWIRHFFVDNSANALQEFTSLEAEQFIDPTFDLTLKNIYNPNLLISFWVKARAEFPLVGCKALCVLVPFATSYLCKGCFSAVAAIKSKYRNRMDIECEMRVAISNISPQFDKMCIEQQAHCSH